MEDKLIKSLLAVCHLFQAHHVQYMIVGGAAVALHGYYRHSINDSGQLTDKPDIDIWYRPTYANYYSLLNVIEALGQNITAFKNEQSPNPKKSYFKLDFDDFTLDLLPSIKAPISFSEAYKRKQVLESGGVQIVLLHHADLIEDKKASGRKKDMQDIKHLNALKRND